MAVPLDKFGQLLTTESYVVEYSYQSTDGPSRLIYTWHGASSPSDRRGQTMAVASHMAASMDKPPVMVRSFSKKNCNFTIN